MIPLLLFGAGVLAINEMDKAEKRTREASQINEEAAKLSDAAYNRVKNIHESMKYSLTRLGKTKEDLLEGNIETLVDILGKIGRKIRIDHDTAGLRELEEAGITEYGLKELQGLTQKSHEMTDVTNQKINIDDNHGWAVLGAMGTAAAGFGVVAAPVLLLYSFMESDKAEAALYKAKTQLDKARLYDEQCRTQEALFEAITKRADQIDNLLDDLNYGYFNDAIKQLQNAYNANKDKTYSAYPREAKLDVYYAWQMADTLKIIINTSMMNEDCTLNVEMEGPLEIGQQALQLLSGETTPEVTIDDAPISAEEAAKLTEYGKDYALASSFVTNEAECYKKAANAGNAEAMYLLGNLYSRGYRDDDSTDRVQESLNWYKKAAAAGNSDAMVYLGRAYYYGNDVEKNYSEAVKWYKQAAENGNADGMFGFGKAYYEGNGVQQDYSEAFKWFMKAAEKGDSSAMYWVAGCYERGEGVQQDHREAVRWYEKAAAIGYGWDMHRLATKFHKGDGCAADYQKAIHWYKKAIEKDPSDNEYKEDLKALLDYMRQKGSAQMYGLADTGQNFKSDGSISENEADVLTEIGIAYRYAKDRKSAFECFKKAADAGNVKAMEWLGDAYYGGEGVKKDYQEAFKWYEKAADNGNTNAMYMIAVCYKDGHGVKKDYQEAIKWYEKAADNGDTNAMSRIADFYKDGEGVPQDNFEAFIWYRKAADNGNTSAMVELGNAYRNGEFVRQDYKEAFKWYKKAAEAGYVPAMNNLASAYAHGEGCNADYEKARYWYKKAIETCPSDSFGRDTYRANLEALLDDMRQTDSENKKVNKKAVARGIKQINKGTDGSLSEEETEDLVQKGRDCDYDDGAAIDYWEKAAKAGNSEAMFLLGSAYQNGYNGVYQDDDEAFEWYKKAAVRGNDWYNARSMHEVGVYCYKGEVVPKDVIQAVSWWKKASELGNTQSMVEIASCYENGIGFQKNYEEAFKWYMQAAGEGHTYAKFSVAYAYAKGRGVQQDFQKAFVWYRKAAEDGHVTSMNNLAYAYENGQGTQEDHQEAVKWYKKAAEEGNTTAMNNLAKKFYDGDGVPQDYQKSKYWYGKSAETGNANGMHWLAWHFHKGLGCNADFQKAKYWYEQTLENETDSDKIEQCKKNLEELLHPQSDGGGCFITTAVCDSFGKADDCYELTAFRKFRDNWLAIQSDGKSLIDEYYNVAPKIVAKINSLGDSAEVYKNIWRDYLSACLKSIEVGDNFKCKKIYVDMVNSLKEKFLK